MKKNKTIIILLFIITLFISIIILNINSSNNSKITENKTNKEKNEKETEKIVGMNKTIIDAIENKKSMNIYFTNNEGKINSSDDTVNMFKKLYNVDIEIYNISKEGKKNLRILEKKLGYYKGFFGPKAFLFIKDGVETGAYSNFEYEFNLYDYFKESNALKEDSYDMYIRTNDIFDNIYNSAELNLMIVCTANSEGDKYRYKINELSKKNIFKFYVVFYHFGGANNIDNIIDEELEGKVEVPALLAVKNGKVIAYNDSKKEDKIINFLKNNGFIK